MEKLRKLQVLCIIIAIVGLVLFTIETFDMHNAVVSRISGAIVLVCLIVNFVCSYIRASKGDD